MDLYQKNRIQPLLSTIQLDTLIDTISAINADIKQATNHYDTRAIEKWKKYKFEEISNKWNEARIGIKDFTIMKKLARGAFGEVRSEVALEDR
jgi:hypothetical protein